MFHELGHGLQHMLTTQIESAVAGVNGLPSDAVEIPSIFMESFVYERDIW